jgi:hypothetical protein
LEVLLFCALANHLAIRLCGHACARGKTIRMIVPCRMFFVIIVFIRHLVLASA